MDRVRMVELGALGRACWVSRAGMAGECTVDMGDVEGGGRLTVEPGQTY